MIYAVTAADRFLLATQIFKKIPVTKQALLQHNSECKQAACFCNKRGTFRSLLTQDEDS